MSFSPPRGRGERQLELLPSPLGGEGGERSEPGEGVSNLLKFVYMSLLILGGVAFFSVATFASPPLQVQERVSQAPGHSGHAEHPFSKRWNLKPCS